MAEVTKFAVPVAQTPRVGDSKLTPFRYDIDVVSGDCPQNDNIAIFTPPAGAVILGAYLAHSASLGANATAQLRLVTVALTGATTQGGSDSELQNAAHLVATADGTNKVNVLIAGAAITASATITVAGYYVMEF